MMSRYVKVKTFLLLSFFALSPVYAQKTLVFTREEKVKSYMEEFVSQGFKESQAKIYTAIQQCLRLIPEEAYKKITDRTFPVIFTEMPHFGGGRWANSSGVYVMPNDPPTFTKGIWIVKLNTQLNETQDVEEIEGIIFHELAHRVLDHVAGAFDIDKEKQANRLVKKWGFERQFLKAKSSFGTHGKRMASASPLLTLNKRSSIIKNL
ncbi:MAG: hypothetical protein HQL15_05945 [Candidatus Omnitrophica bacterium]|nr:hypothetical protein [Candidatus Omnitrophota bacterium]